MLIYLLWFEVVEEDVPELLGVYATSELAKAGAEEHFDRNYASVEWNGYVLDEWKKDILNLLLKEDSSYDKAGDESGRFYYYESREVIGA